MKPIVQLNTFIGEMEVVGDQVKVFLNVQTGDYITLSDEELNAAENEDDLEDYPEWQREVIKEAEKVLFSSGEYLELPSKFDIHEYSIMGKFCYSVDDENISTDLENSIRGRGAFRYFKDSIYRYGIQDDWYAFRANEFKKIAIDWLESHNIAYTD